jgi:predicted nucleic acid-binding protein
VTTVVVDSSVALKWFVPEVHSDRAASLLGTSIQLAAPDLLYPEAGNIVWKKVGRGELQPDEGREVIAGLRRVPIAIASSSVLLEAALEIALAHQRTVYDSLYVSLAVARDCDFVTADERLANALGAGPLGPRVKVLSTYVPS